VLPRLLQLLTVLGAGLEVAAEEEEGRGREKEKEKEKEVRCFRSESLRYCPCDDHHTAYWYRGGSPSRIHAKVLPERAQS